MKPEKPEKISITDQVREFYDKHPYPPPVDGLEGYRQKWEDSSRRSDFHLFWPGSAYREDLSILVAGCGTSQAAKYAIRHPAAQVVGIDLSSTSVQQTLAFKKKYSLENLSVHQLPIERVAELKKTFDKIICTGVLHHLPDPQLGLRALAQVLDPHGAMHLMVYAAYGRFSVYMLQEYARLLGVSDAEQEIIDFANTLMSLPDTHPLAPLLAESPDFRTKAGLADALLNPQERAFTVPEFMELISSAGLRFRRWLRQAPYLPQCSRFAETPHFPRLDQLPLQDQYAAMELLRGTMLRHSAIVSHQSDQKDQYSVPFDHANWPACIPIRLPGSISVKDNLPPGANTVLINQYHTFPDLVLPVDRSQMQIIEAVNGLRSMGEIISSLSSFGDPKMTENRARSFFQQLWSYDHVVFDTSGTTE